MLALTLQAGATSAASNDGSPAWPSGFGNYDLGHEYEHLLADEANYLHRPTPVFTSFYVQHHTIAEATAALGDKARLWRQLARAEIRVAQTVPLVMNADAGAIARILSPSDPLHDRYVAFWTGLGQGLHDAGAVAPILRLGHEMNLAAGYPWSYGNPARTAADFVALYELAADAIRARAPDAVRGWNPGKRTAKGRPEDLWPGDRDVDVVLLDWYDNGTYGFVTGEAAWDALARETDAHGPVGLYRWYAFARAHEKPFGVPEWGLTGPRRTSGTPTDRPLYIQKMHDFFTRVKSHLMLESYYNWDQVGSGAHQLYPVLPTHAESSRLYQRLFGRP